MGNREALLAGARRCLEERGWARTTVRDIVAAAGGVSMAAIGYHFGSRDALLTAALIDALDDWGAELGRTLAGEAGADALSAPQYERLWARMIESFGAHQRLWLASVEALLQAEHSPDLRRHLADALREGRRGLAAMLLGIGDEAVDESSARTLGSAQLALVSGVMVQWLADPGQAPSGAELVAGLRMIAAIVSTPDSSPESQRR